MERILTEPHGCCHSSRQKSEKRICVCVVIVPCRNEAREMLRDGEKTLKVSAVKVTNWSLIPPGIPSRADNIPLRVFLLSSNWEKISSIRVHRPLVGGYSAGIISVLHPPTPCMDYCQFLGIRGLTVRDRY